MTRRTLATLALSLAAVPLAAQQPKDFGPYLMDRAAEIALARTAAPKNVSDSATILVMTRTGFVEAVHGTNGFTCAVFRSYAAPSNASGLFDVKISAPQCFNPPAARSVLPAWLKRMEWIMGGATPEETDKRIEAGYASHQFPAPEPGSMAYMLSRQQHLNNGAHPEWKAHLMFFYDKGTPGALFGATSDGNPPLIDASVGDPHAVILTVLIPVEQWSDGSMAMGGH